MNARTTWALLALVALLTAAPGANRSAAVMLTPANGQRHHYTLAARVRPLLFWAGKDDVGDAVIAKTQDGDAAGYALLIGSDPERTPRRINRWGYIAEEIRGGEATVVGLMTESDETSVAEAEASLQKQGNERTINVIHGSIRNGEACSVVTAVTAPADYTFRQVDMVLDLAGRKAAEGSSRVVQLPAGTRPGFLSAIADLMHQQATGRRGAHAVSMGEPIDFAYDGKLYQLRATRSHVVTNFRAGSVTIEHAIASQFQIKDVLSGELTDFSITYGVDGPLAEMPITATYRPRWWLEIQLTLDDSAAGPVQDPTRTGTNP